MSQLSLPAVKARLDSLPTPIAIPLADLLDERQQSPLVKLWQICDSVELLLRLLVSICVSQLDQSGALGRAPHLKEFLRANIERPTLGRWWQLLRKLAPLTSVSGAPDLQRFVHSVLPEFLGDRKSMPGEARVKLDPVSYFADLRNRLAHGAGLTDGAAEKLLPGWSRKFEKLFEDCLWLADLQLSAVDGRGEVVLLHGVTPWAAGSSTSGETGRKAGRVDASSGDGRISLWPLLRFEAPTVEDNIAMADAQRLVEIYARRDEVSSLYYTPLGSEDVAWSLGDREAAECFDRILELPANYNVAKRRGAFASYRADIEKDANAFIGREKQIDMVLKAIDRYPGRILWVSGKAGIGKSFLMARLADLVDHDEMRDTVVIPYRFKVGDSRCSAGAFFQLCTESLRRESEQDKRKQYGKGDFQLALREQESSGKSCTFLIDGLDEINEVDREFVAELCATVPLAPRSTWVLAGRPGREVDATLDAAGCKVVFQGGMEIMRPEDVRAMLLDQIGNIRQRLIEADKVCRGESVCSVAASKDLVKKLDDRKIPEDVFAAFNSAPLEPRIKLDPFSYTLPTQPGKEWLIYDNDDAEIYYGALDEHTNSIHFSRDRIVESPLINQVCEKSNGFPLYVRYVIGEIRAGRLKRLDGTEPLPQGLEEFYDKLLDRHAIGTLNQAITPLLCLIAVSREPLTMRQLAERLTRPPWQIIDEDDDECDAASYVEAAIRFLAPMLRTAPLADGQMAYTIYHHSLREHLRVARTTADSVRAARKWLATVACVRISLEADDPFAGYVARNGTWHLLDQNDLPRAISLVDYLKNCKGLERFQLSRGHLIRFTKEIARSIRGTLTAIDASESEPAKRRKMEERLSNLPVQHLKSIFADIYETGVLTAPLRAVIQYQDKAWEEIRANFVSPENLVAKQSISEALADVYESTGEKKVLAGLLERVTTEKNLNEREVASYALRFIYTRDSSEIDESVLGLWSRSPIYIEPMILGELLVNLALRRDARVPALLEAIQCSGFFRPIWEYLRIDVREILVLVDDARIYSYAKTLLPTDVATAAAELRIAEGLKAKMLALDKNDASEVRRAAANVAKHFEMLGGDEEPVSDFHKAVLHHGGADNLQVVTAVAHLLFSHPLWAVGEQGSSLIATLCESDPRFLVIIDRILDQVAAKKTGDIENWRLAYGAVDAAFNVRELHGAERFERAVRLCFGHANGRVRGICADDLAGWIRDVEPAERGAILDRFEREIRHWLAEANDCFELEYVYLLFRYLHCNGFDVGEWLGDEGKRSPYFAGEGGSPFFAMERDDFLRRMNRIRSLEMGVPYDD